MIFYIVCALLLLNAFTAEAQTIPPCEDEAGEDFCRAGPKRVGQCDLSKTQFRPIQMMCAKTCGLCKEN